jgi:hypothetical protein
VSRVFWPSAEAAQADYEMLRARVLADGCLPACPAAARFTRGGLAGLITRPSADPVFTAELCGAAWPRWTGNDDPRQRALADGYQFLLGLAGALAAPGLNMTEGCS